MRYLYIVVLQIRVCAYFGGQKYLFRKKKKIRRKFPPKKKEGKQAPAVEIIYLPTAIKSSLHVW